MINSGDSDHKNKTAPTAWCCGDVRHPSLRWSVHFRLRHRRFPEPGWSSPVLPPTLTLRLSLNRKQQPLSLVLHKSLLLQPRGSLLCQSPLHATPFLLIASTSATLDRKLGVPRPSSAKMAPALPIKFSEVLNVSRDSLPCAGRCDNANSF